MKATETTRTRVNTAATATPTVEERLSATAVATLFVGSGLIGVWSFAALVGGLLEAGGPVGLAGSWFRAVSGI